MFMGGCSADDMLADRAAWPRQGWHQYCTSWGDKVEGEEFLLDCSGSDALQATASAPGMGLPMAAQHSSFRQAQTLRGPQAGIGMVLYLLQINLIPFATAGGVGGILLGFASQSVLANIVAGTNVLITRQASASPNLTDQPASAPAHRVRQPARPWQAQREPGSLRMLQELIAVGAWLHLLQLSLAMRHTVCSRWCGAGTKLHPLAAGS